MLYHHGKMKILQQKHRTHSLISKVVQGDLWLPVTKDSTCDVNKKICLNIDRFGIRDTYTK